jgi:hypothetical protein
MQTITCPHCSRQISDDESLRGKVVDCPQCHGQFTMPASVDKEPSWFMAMDKKKLGPFNQAQLKAMIPYGQIQPSTMVLREGEQRWTTAGSVGEIFPAAVPQKIPEVIPAPASSLPGLSSPPISERVSPVDQHRQSNAGFVIGGAVTLVLVGLLLALWGAGVLHLQGPADEGSEARVKLKIVMDSWVFREKTEDVERSHPEIKASVVGMGLYKILKYEIVSERKKEVLGYEFAVTIIYQSEAGTEIKKNAKFSVYKGGNTWHVNSFGG